MSNPLPCLVLTGPDNHGMLYSVDIHGNRQDIFASYATDTKPQLHMSRIVQGGLQQPFGTAKLSSLSGTITIDVHGQRVKMKDSWEGMQYNKYFQGPSGEMKWRPTGWGNGMELWDQTGVMVGRYTYLKLSGQPRLEIFVRLNDLLLDLVVTAAVSIYVDEKKGLKIVSKVIEAICS